jgi:hypothetical protein
MREPTTQRFQDIEFITSERGFEAVRESHEKVILVASWRASDNTDGAAPMHEGALRFSHLNQRYDLGARKNVVRLVGHSSK